MSVARCAHSVDRSLVRGLWSNLGAVLLAALVMVGSGWGALHAGLAHAPVSQADSEKPVPPKQSTDDCITCHLVRTLTAADIAPPTAVAGTAPLVDCIAVPEAHTPVDAADLPFPARGPPRFA